MKETDEEVLRVVEHMEKLTEIYSITMKLFAEQLVLPEAQDFATVLNEYLSDLAGDTFRFWRKLIEKRDEIGDDR